MPKGLAGVARSMPTSRAADRVAEKLGINCFETPTGWKFFANLLDAGLITLCGEESAGTGSNHIREKDGLWAVLLWLNILAVTKKPADADRARALGQLRARLLHAPRLRGARHGRGERADGRPARPSSPSLPGQRFGGLTVQSCDDFAYTDPVDGSVTPKQGVRILFDGGCARRLPPLGDRHRGRDPAGSISSASSRTRTGTTCRRPMCWRGHAEAANAIADIAPAPGAASRAS